MFSGNFLRAVQPVYIHVCLAWSDFPTGGAGSRPLLRWCHLAASMSTAYIMHVIVMNSESAACMRQNMCTADHNTPSLY
jgi:hypothetical protein